MKYQKSIAKYQPNVSTQNLARGSCFMFKDILPKILIAQYIICAIVYAYNKDLGRTIYWIGATIIVSGTLLMK